MKSSFYVLLLIMGLILTGCLEDSKNVKLENGTPYEGKIVLHSQSENSGEFECEGRNAPEAILENDGGEDWRLTINEEDSCKAYADVPVEGVVFNPKSQTARYKGILFKSAQ